MVRPGIPKTDDTASENRLTGTDTLVKPEHKLTAVKANIPTSIDNITERTGVCEPDIFWIITSIINIPAHIPAISHTDIEQYTPS